MAKSLYTPGPWDYSPYVGTPEEIEQARKHGMEPIRMLSNDGQATVMAGAGDDHKPVARIECQIRYKRGQGHATDCAERDANARLIAAAPQLLEATQLFLAAFSGTDPDKIEDTDPDSAKAIRVALAAVAKATP